MTRGKKVGWGEPTREIAAREENLMQSPSHATFLHLYSKVESKTGTKVSYTKDIPDGMHVCCNVCTEGYSSHRSFSNAVGHIPAISYNRGGSAPLASSWSRMMNNELAFLDLMEKRT